MNPIIFLDIDGVIVLPSGIQRGCSGLRSKADDICVRNLNRVISQTQSDIVLSSAWRYCGLLEMRNIFGVWGIRPSALIDMTPLTHKAANGDILLSTKEETWRSAGPTGEWTTRGEEIYEWIKRSKYKGPFVIIDDCHTESMYLRSFADGAFIPDKKASRILTCRHVRTELEHGLTDVHADNAIKVIKNFNRVN